jgi:prophage regulatory protein
MSKRLCEILRLAEVQRRTGLPTSTLYKLMSEGTFPRQVPIGARTVGWASDEIDRWIEERVAERDDKWQSLGDVAAEVVKKCRPT